MSGDPNSANGDSFDANLSLGDFVVGERADVISPPAGWTEWRQGASWAAQLYQPTMLQSADARTEIEYDGRPHPVINLCSYNYLGLANHPEVIAAAIEALHKYGMGACG